MSQLFGDALDKDFFLSNIKICRRTHHSHNDIIRGILSVQDKSLTEPREMFKHNDIRRSLAPNLFGSVRNQREAISISPQDFTRREKANKLDDGRRAI